MGPTAMPSSTPRPSAVRRRSLVAVVALGAGLTACAPGEDAAARTSPADADVGGTVVIATAADASALLPVFFDRATDVHVASLIFDRLATIGDDLNVVGDRGFTPRLAERWTWGADSLSIAFHLNPKARWHDGRPVRASDVRFSWQLYADPVVGSPVRALIPNIDSVSVRDSLTAVFHYKARRPDQFFEAVYQLIPVPEHLLKDANRKELRAAPFAKRPVGTGKYRFASWTPGQRLELVADTANYRGRPNIDRVIWNVVPDPQAAFAALTAGQADFFEILSPDQLKQLRTNPDLKAAPYPTLDYAFMGFNLRGPGRRGAHPLFADRQLRRALSMALDREAMVRNVFDSQAAVALGPVVRGLNPDTTQLRPIPYDLAGARALLDSLGWKDANGDGVRERNGRPLQFSLLTPTSSAFRRRYAVLIQEQLRQAGVKVDVEPLEFNVWMDRQSKGAFDATLGAHHVDPAPGSIRQNWSTAGAREADGSNYGGYESRAFDAAVDSALASMDPAVARRHFARAYQTILDDAPAVWLYEPRWSAGVHKRIQPVGMRGDGWWVRFDEWRIPADQRIPRDRIPPGAPAR